MQFLHLFSFVVVASYAAALPQPAGLSEKYPNDVDATLAPGLEARSYQPGSNSYKDSAAVMLLKRQDGTKDIKKILDDATKRGDFSSANISSTIDKVGDGIFNFPEDGEKVAQKVDGILGEMLSGYIKRSTYVGTALDKWMRVEEVNILLTIKSILGDDVFSRLFPVFLGKSKELTDSVTAKEKEVAEATSNILKDTGTVIQNVEKIHASFKLAFDSRMTRLIC
ncbi:hypothetical protein BASA60_007117 [Batrachochytrium salamandrivorans]|nr:hypothetical protein BASA60_007117 [Batrachochytrium salamandrivorans]